ncbi:MAG: hypothetical protein EZS28_005597 [Streblomastix strix]|uniref:Kinesin-like protein n=1 Tax=Streblomastix strix TaxID=222440 RepID=A0A5J4WV69_9EUKA|nr:MAG: hypothetical protein EZS28_005597 [Streblomastix strix]
MKERQPDLNLKNQDKNRESRQQNYNYDNLNVNSGSIFAGIRGEQKFQHLTSDLNTLMQQVRNEDIKNDQQHRKKEHKHKKKDKANEIDRINKDDEKHHDKDREHRRRKDKSKSKKKSKATKEISNKLQVSMKDVKKDNDFKREKDIKRDKSQDIIQDDRIKIINKISRNKVKMDEKKDDQKESVKFPSRNQSRNQSRNYDSMRQVSQFGAFDAQLGDDIVMFGSRQGDDDRDTYASASGGSNYQMKRIKAIVRIKKIEENKALQWNIDSTKTFIYSVENRDINFKFNHIFDGSSTQQNIYSQIQPFIEHFINGYNATIMAYGQTGSGKTYTTFGDVYNPGIVCHAVDEIFQRIKETLFTELSSNLQSENDKESKMMKDELQPNVSKIKSVLYFVDLAGSERIGQTKTEGITQKEGKLL